MTSLSKACFLMIETFSLFSTFIKIEIIKDTFLLDYNILGVRRLFCYIFIGV